jgi:hypothetical protein
MYTSINEGVNLSQTGVVESDYRELDKKEVDPYEEYDALYKKYDQAAKEKDEAAREL